MTGNTNRPDPPPRRYSSGQLVIPPLMGPPRVVFVAPRYPAGDYPQVSRIRSTLLSASLQGLRQMGWETRYFAQLPAALHQELRSLVAGVWVPLSLAVSHYEACDRMGLSRDETKEMGRGISLRTQKTFAATLGGIAAGAGATPWNIFQHTHRLWDRIFDGGDSVAYRAGPKDIDFVAMGCPLVRVPYFRTAMGSYYAAVAGLVSKSVHWHELREDHGDKAIALRISWV